MIHITTRVSKVTEKFITKSVSKNGKAEVESLGWFILLEGSNEYLHAGTTPPDFVVGDKVWITIRKR